MTIHSVAEQESADLNHGTEELIKKLTALNKEYHENNKFPFIIAVKGLTLNRNSRSYRKTCS